MCPACLAAAVVTAAKVASTGAAAIYGVKKLLSIPDPQTQTTTPSESGDLNETAEDRIAE
jgi:hypothetical protein